MNQETILNIIVFLKRATLTGEEVPAFNNWINALNAEYEILEQEKKKKEEEVIKTIEEAKGK